MDTSSVKSEVESVNPYFPPPAVKLTPRRQKSHVEALAKPRRGIVAEKPMVEKVEGDTKNRVLCSIYKRMEMAHRTSSQGRQQCKLRPDQQEDVAHRLYYESMQQKGRMVQEIRAKYRLHLPTAKPLQQDGVDDLVLRLYRPPSAPSILGRVLHSYSGDPPKKSPQHAALRRFQYGSSSGDDDAAVHSDTAAVADSAGLSGPIRVHKKRATTVMTTSGTTVLACIKQSRQAQGVSGLEQQAAYDAQADPHLVLYWKELRRSRRRTQRAAAEEERRRRAEREASGREKRHHGVPKQSAGNLWHLRELLMKEELHARLIIKMNESDVRKDLRDAYQGEQHPDAEAEKGATAHVIPTWNNRRTKTSPSTMPGRPAEKEALGGTPDSGGPVQGEDAASATGPSEHGSAPADNHFAGAGSSSASSDPDESSAASEKSEDASDADDSDSDRDSDTHESSDTSGDSEDSADSS
eukprot:GGOE01043495.1.p1 GENE.GGOE01043495.1~~GGOE01043495.1.p1  ORF type:complete len:466 (+),score=134.31 GGOE01043495.1:66-1463(+)